MTGSNPASMPVGIIGLGIMGGAIARNLLAGGSAVVGYDIDPEICADLRSLGADITASAKHVVEACPITLTSLPSPSALASVVGGPDGVMQARGKDRLLVELSTLRIEDKQDACQNLATVGIDMLDAPISGTGKQAQSKDISIYASGSEKGFARARPVFDAIARSCHFVGAFGNGSRMKFVANLLVAIHNVATAEALVLGIKSGLDPDTLLRVIGDGAGSSRMFQVRGPVMVEQTYDDAGMKMDVWQKDLQIIDEFARKNGTQTPLFDSSVTLYKAALDAGFSKQDTAVVCRILEQMAGLQR